MFCASSTAVDPRYLELADALGTELGRRGHTLVSGGGRVSMMGAVAVAARAAGARTIGVIPRVLYDWEVADTAADELVVVSDMAERKSVMMAKADAFITLPGGLGTLDELFEVWTTGSIGLHSKPVVLLDPDGFFGSLRQWLDGLRAAGFVRDDAMELLIEARSVPQAVDLAERASDAR